MLKHIMCKSVLVGVGLFSLITFGHAYGTTYYTALAGSDSNSCSQATSTSTPKRTINQGLRCLSAGDTLFIRGGTYAEALDAVVGTQWPSGTSWTNAVTVAGYPGETAIIQPTSIGSGYLVGMYTPSGTTQYIILDNLTFSETRTGIAAIIKPDAGSANIRISNSKITGRLDDISAYQNAILAGGPGMQIVNNEISNVSGYGIYFLGEGSLIEGNYIHDVGGYGIHHYRNDCHTCANNNIIRGNRVDHNGRITGDAGRPGCGMVIASGSNNMVYNNIVADQQNGACGIQIYATSVDIKVYNNTIVGNGGGCININPGSSGAIIRNNICYDNGSGITDAGSGATIDHNTTNAINPQFVNATGADFHLQPTSPAIDTGLTISIITMDRAEVSRPQGKGYDIGAYEYVGNQLPVPSKLRVINAQ
jgi:hypothetical protein